MSNPIRGLGSIWIQDDPKEAFDLLTCIGSGGPVTHPKRPNEARYCDDPKRAGRYKISRLIQGEADLPSTSLVQIYDSVYNFLLEEECDFQLRINHSCEDTDKSVFQNYYVAQHLHGARVDTSEVEDPVARQPGDEDEVLVNGDIVAVEIKTVKKLDGASQTDNTATTEAINDIEFLPPKCFSQCAGGLVKEGEVGWAALDTAGYLAGDPVIYTTDFGQTWSVTTTEPFNGSRNALAVELIQISGEDYRVLVAGSDDVGQPAEVSYSDDEGETWTDVVVGSTNGQGVNMLFRDQLGRVWAAADGGYIYMSKTQGQSWVTKAAGSPSTEDLFDIVFFDDKKGYAVGENNEFWYTVDGGDTWSIRTGPAGVTDVLNTVAVNHVGHVFVGADNGTMYRSFDEGETWDEDDELEFSGGTGSVKRIRFDRDLLYFGYLIYDNATPNGYIYRTEDGGPSWVQQEYITNNGLNAVHVLSTNYVYAGGEPVGGVSFISRYIRSAT